jgi:hypothetical protein
MDNIFEDNIFEDAHGRALRPHSDLQPLTAPIIIILREYKELGWQMMQPDVSYATLEDAVASHDWFTLDFEEFLEDYMLDHDDCLPYEILELHPENGARLWVLACTGPHQFECWNADQFAIDHAIKARVLVRDY